MTNYKQEIEMVKFAMENGFTQVDIKNVGKDFMFTGSWGTFVVDVKGMIELSELIVSYKTVAKEVIETVEVVEEVISNKEITNVAVDALPLTTNEKEVLQEIINNTDEYGLGMQTSDLDLSIKGKKVSGVIGSLVKKGYVESYLDGESVGHDDFFNLTEEWFEKLVW
jgi:hypothetical protein